MAATQHYFTDDDIKKISQVQGQIQTDIAVATNNLNWIITTYKNQGVEIESLKNKVEDLRKEIGNIKITVWKYIGMGAGAVIAIELFVMALPYLKGVIA